MKYYDGVLQRVRKLEEKNAIFYAKPDGKLYNVLKILYIVAFLYGVFNTLAYLAGILIAYSDFLNEFLSDILTPAICSVSMIVGFIFLFKKLHIAAAVLNVIPATVLIFFFRYRLLDEFTIDSVYPKYYWRHLAPMLLIIALVLWLGGIALRAELKTKSQYTRVTENLYNLYKVNVGDGEEISEEQWEEFLERYDPFSYNPQFLTNMEKEDKIEGQSDT